MKRNSVHSLSPIPSLFLFILCLFFLEGEKKKGKGEKCGQKMHRDLFHQKFNLKTNYEHIEKLAIGTNKVLNSYKFVGPIILM